MPSKCLHYGDNAPENCNDCSRYDLWGGGSIGFSSWEGSESCTGRYHYEEGLTVADYSKVYVFRVPSDEFSGLAQKLGEAAAEFEDRFVADALGCDPIPRLP